MVAGLLRRQRAGQPRHLDPHGVVQVLFTGVDRAGDDDRHPEQTGPVLLRGQEVQLCTHLKQETEKLRSKEYITNITTELPLTIFLCIAMMYPIKGLSWTGVTCPLATPFVRGISGLEGTRELGPPLGISTG